jgi:hypothetical protein
METLVVDQNNAATTTNLISKPIALNFNLALNDGNDTLRFGNGDVDDTGCYTTNSTILGGNGTDAIQVDDSQDVYDQFRKRNPSPSTSSR